MVQELLWGHTETWTDRQNVDIISLIFLFTETKLNTEIKLFKELTAVYSGNNTEHTNTKSSVTGYKDS
jgi:hypothetical protein